VTVKEGTGEETVHRPLSKMSTSYLKSPTFLAKILELALNSVATALFMADTYYLQTTKPFGTLIGFIMISIIIIITTILDSPLHRYVMLMTTFCAAFLFFASGGLIFEMWANNSHVTGYLISSGFFAFSNGLVYLVDCALTFFKHV